jgi:MFS family permease
MRQFSRTRSLVTAFFALEGFLFANWVVRVPAVKAHVGASAGGLGLALLGSSAGAVLTMMVSGRLCARFGSERMMLAGATLTSLAITVPARVTSVPALAAALVVFGSGFGALDVAMNSAAVELIRRLRRPIMPSFHAAFSIGGLSGALVGGALAGALSPAAHLEAIGVFGLVVTACCGPTLLRRQSASDTAAGQDEPAERPPPDASAAPARTRAQAALGRHTTAVVVLGLIALCSSYCEGGMADWGALHLRADLHTSAGLAAAGYAAFSAAMVAGRLSGSWMLRRGGRTLVLVGGALTAAAGMLVAALAPVLALVIAGFAFVGLGLANLFPAGVGGAGALAGPRGVALASTIGYSGFLAGPPLIGFLADRVGLPAALTTISALAALAALVALVAHRLAPEG